MNQSIFSLETGWSCFNSIHICPDDNIKLHVCRVSEIFPAWTGSRPKEPHPWMIPVIVFDITCCAESCAVFIIEPRKACHFADSLLLICAGGTVRGCVSCRACYGTQGGRVVSVHNMVIVHRGNKVKDLKLVFKKKKGDSVRSCVKMEHVKRTDVCTSSS